MQLKTLNYTEFKDTDQHWSLEGLTLGSLNLIVGKNASGKSRSLNIITALANQLTGRRAPTFSGQYDIEFSHNNEIIKYLVSFDNELVINENLYINGKLLLERGDGGEGEIWADEIDGGKKIRFQTPPTELAVVARRDLIQHVFLEPLYLWGDSLRHFYFGTQLGKDRLALFVNKGGKKIDDRDTTNVVPLFRRAFDEFGNNFVKAIIGDMKDLDYDIEEVGVAVPVSIHIEAVPQGEVVGLYVKEKSLPGITDQYSMSQGMFRALSIVIQVNYSSMAKKATCIIIDDIGEGLDFDRSCRLIDILRKKATLSSIQLILSTNDRFVMNNVPLEEWSVISRHGGNVKVLNNQNSPELFENFKFTGLSNFSFLELDYLNSHQETTNTGKSSNE